MSFKFSVGKFSTKAYTAINTDMCKYKMPYMPPDGVPGDLWYKEDTGEIFILI